MKYLLAIFLPVPENKYQAYLLRQIVLIPLVFLLIISNLVGIYSSRKNQKIQGVQTDLSPSQVISLTNLERTKAGVRPLQPNELLSLAAQKKADSMIETGVFEHYYESQGELINPWQFILDSGYEYYHAGENLGRGFSEADTLVEAWIDSPTHKENLLNPDYTEIGVAVVQGPYLEKEETTLVVQLFATPVSAVLLDNNVRPANPGDISIAPLLDQKQSWAQSLISQYPILLFGLTFSVVVMIGITLLIDMETAKKRANDKAVSIDLWRH